MLSCTAYSKGQVEKSYHKDNTFGIFTLVFTMQIKESFNILISFHFISFHYSCYSGTMQTEYRGRRCAVMGDLVSQLLTDHKGYP